MSTHECPDCRCAERAEVDAFMGQVSRDDGRRSPTDNCWDVADGFDGFFVHTGECPSVGIGYTGGNRCVGLRKWRGYHQPWMDRPAPPLSVQSPDADGAPQPEKEKQR